jgi:hypothetical protein
MIFVNLSVTDFLDTLILRGRREPILVVGTTSARPPGRRSRAAFRVLERFQAKWKPVRIKKTRQIKNLEPRFDSIEAERL